MEIKVLIADQERTFAEVLAARLDGEEDIKVVGAIQVTLPSPWLIAATSADVVVLDGDLPDEAASKLCEELASHKRATRVIALSTSSEPTRIVHAIKAGAVAWVRKDESLEYLLLAIRGVARGETWVAPSDLSGVVRLLLHERELQRKSQQVLATLTPRERAVLACLADGAGHREAVAEQLNLSVNTVRTHLRNLMAKLGVHSALEAVALIRTEEDRIPVSGCP